MEENVFDSIEDIDAALDKQLDEVANKSSDENVNNEAEETDTNVEDLDTEENKDVEPVDNSKKDDEVKEDQPNVEKADSKKSHAFADLRAENGNLKKERDEYKSDSDFLKELASSYGYNDVSKFQEAVKNTRYEKEAQEKGYDLELYRKTIEQEERIAKLEKEREQQVLDRKVERFKNALEKAVTKYDVDEEEIFTRLENSGISADELLSISNPTLLLDGVLLDKIQNNAKQSQINEINNMKGLVEDKNETSGTTKSITIDDLLKEDLAKYKKENFFE